MPYSYRAVLDGPTMPIIGEGDKEANDEFVEQLVSSARAAVEEVIRLGIGKEGSFVCGGHSYGGIQPTSIICVAFVVAAVTVLYDYCKMD